MKNDLLYLLVDEILQALYHLLNPNTLQSTHQTHTSKMPGQANASAITLHVHLNLRKCYLEIILSYSTIFLLVFIDNFRNSYFNFF